MAMTHTAQSLARFFTTKIAPAGSWVLPETSGEKSYDYHETVLLGETVDAGMPEGVDAPLIVDCTCGGAGHTRLLLEKGAQVIALDRDPEALRRAEVLLAPFGDRVILVKGNFADIASVVAAHGDGGKVDGVIADFGVSSWQIDTPERGFSFQKDGPLDMRMGHDAPQTAAEMVNQTPEDELARIIYIYGDEKQSRRIARAICERRATRPFERTLDLADVIASVVRKTGRTHPATKSFQALRIAVNGELDAIESLLSALPNVLRAGGRAALISFHSLEDRLVKQFFRAQSQPEIDRPEWPEPRANPDYHFDLISRRAVVANTDEVARNPRSRSARLRVAQRI